MLKKRTLIVVTMLLTIFIICFVLIYFYFIRDWRSKINLNEKTMDIIAEKANDSDFEFSDFDEIGKRIDEKYTAMGYDVSVDNSILTKTITVWGDIADTSNNDVMSISFAVKGYENNNYTPAIFPTPSNYKSFKNLLKTEYGLFRPIFTCFCNKHSSDSYKYYFTPFCWQKDEYHLALGSEAQCHGIIICKNYIFSFYYVSYDIEHVNSLNSFLEDISTSIS